MYLVDHISCELNHASSKSYIMWIESCI